MKKRQKIFAMVLIMYVIGGCLAAQEAKQDYEGAWFDESRRIRLHLFGTRFAMFDTEYDFEAMGFLTIFGDRFVFNTRECTVPNLPTTADITERLQMLVLMIAAGEVPGFFAALFTETYITREDNWLIIRVVDEYSKITSSYEFERIE